MREFMESSAFFGVFICLFSYEIGMYIKNKTRLSVFNPLLVSIVFVIILLTVFRIDVDAFSSSAKYLSYLLTPATVCLAVPLYERLGLLKSNLKAILAGIIGGALTSLTCILGMVLLFRMSREHYITLLPKSITTAIGMGLSEELGGYPTITAAVIIITGVLGNVISPLIFRLFRITDPIAQGIGLGSSAHAIGTAKAMEMGEIQGAMSSLSIAVSGLLTVIMAGIYANLM